MNIVSCAMLSSILLSLPERASVSQVTDYHRESMLIPPMKWFCRMGGKAKFSEKDIRGMRETAALKAADRNPYSWNMEFYLYEKRDVYNIASLMPGVLMLVGVGELISERIAGLDRILSGKRLFRGFGALTTGGLLGIPLAIAGFKRNKKRAAFMLAGSALCAFFAGLLFAGYKKQ